MTPSGPKKGLLIVATPKGSGDDSGSGDLPPLGPPSSSDNDGDEGQTPQGSGGQECSNCKFYRPGMGYCVRYPPHGPEWSLVNPDDWCGEWRGGPQHHFDQDSGGQSASPQSSPQAPPSGGGGGQYLGPQAPGAR